MTTVRPFVVDIAQNRLDDLRARLASTRWPDEVVSAPWDYGTDMTYLKELVAYWQHEFDWRAQEAKINDLPQYTIAIDGLRLHFVHARGDGEDPIPLLLLHGWPSSFLQMTRILPLLTRAGNASFDVVAPSLPGYAFSERPSEPGWSVGRVARALAKLMNDLGYERYAVRSSDLGAGVAYALPPQVVIGHHMSGTNPYLQKIPDDLSDTERDFVERLVEWRQREFAYAELHATKPQTIAYALNDSPAGLAAWVIEKFRSWSDCDGEVETVWPKDDLLTNVTVYWLTETVGSSMRLYAESMRAMQSQQGDERWGQDEAWSPPPTAIAMFPKDMVPTPRSFAERQGPIDHWHDMPSGGHFGEWEAPELLAEDMRQFFVSLETES